MGEEDKYVELSLSCAVIYYYTVHIMQMQSVGMPGSNMSPMPSRGGKTMPEMSVSAQQQLQEQQQQGKP